VHEQKTHSDSALVQFVKRRDPRVTQQMERMVKEQYKKEEEKKREAVRQKEEIAAAKEVGPRFLFVDEEFNIATLSQKHLTRTKEWMAEAERNMREQQAADLDAGRIRLANLDSNDDDNQQLEQAAQEAGEKVTFFTLMNNFLYGDM